MNVLTENLGTIITALIVFGITACIIGKMIRDKVKGRRPGCNCGCGGCSGAQKEKS